MITEYVLFGLRPGMSREEVVEGMRGVAPKWRANPDLIRKTFIYDAEAEQAGAFYLWKTRAAAEAAHDAAWRQSVRDNFGSEPEIRYFETPLVVDNAMERVIEAGDAAG
ncbi:monooxygenase [Rhodobacteraceae bacterium WD3A24]|nr:monooxygenase [Rhodobacteraceae bacterium WD3A24]